MSLELLRVDNLTKVFGGVVAVRECSFNVDEKKIYGLIGPNGSGKTTLFNLITGMVKPSGGNVYLHGKAITKLKSSQIALSGIGRTFQMIRLFRRMTTLENLLAVVPTKSYKETDRAVELLEYMELKDVKDKLASELSYGQQKQLEFARVLMTNPKLILLDEPTAGLNPKMIERMMRYIVECRNTGQTSIVVEHNMGVIMELCEEIFVLNHGVKIAEGTVDEIRKDKAVIDAYLGY